MNKDYREDIPEGMKLSENNKRVFNIINRLNNFTEGYCPCVPDSIGKEKYKCPCKKCREDNICCCKLYEKSN